MGTMGLAKLGGLELGLAEAVAREVGEAKPIWVGQSDPASAKRDGMAIWLFAVPWLLFSLFWEVVVFGFAIGGFFKPVTSEAGPWLLWGMVLFGLPFVALGVWMTHLPFRAASLARTTAFVLTDERFFVITKKPSGTLTTRSFRPDDIGGMTLTERPDGSGSIKLITGYNRDSEGVAETTEKILGIPDVRNTNRLFSLWKSGKKS